MPGILHQGILSLFRDVPWVGHSLLGYERPVDGIPIDRANELDVDAIKRHLQVNPIFPDLVLVYRDPHNPKIGIVLVVEAQLENDPDKYFQILGYQGLLMALHRLGVRIVIVSFSRAYSRLVRSWKRCDPPINALLLDADTVPVMTLEQARACPAAAVLVGALHGARGNIDMARIAITAVWDLPDPPREKYIATVLASLTPRRRASLRKELPMREREQLWELEKRSGTYQLGRKEGRQEGRQATLIELILTVLDVRGIGVDLDSIARIRAETTLATLERWAVAVRNVAHVSELFEPR